MNFLKNHYRSTSTFISSKDLPNIKQILLPQQYWIISILPIDPTDYYNIKMYHNLPISHQNSTNSQSQQSKKNECGPDCFNDLLKQNNITQKIEHYTNSHQKFKKETKQKFKDMRIDLTKHVNGYNADSIIYLKNDIQKNFENLFKNKQETFINCCQNAFEIVSTWNQNFLHGYP